MIDLHNDLLSYLYFSYIRNDFSYIEEWIRKLSDDNVSALLANLYFVSRDRMKEEMGIENINVVEMFKISTELFKKYLPNKKVIFSIEGCDYIESLEELEELYNLGLRNILLVWNNPNKYGSGNLGDYGLTEEGKKFLIKAIDLGISIDLSHMNKKTFWDTIELIKEQKALGKRVKALASHSNCYLLCNARRNLDDEQLKALKDIGALLGIVAYETFVKTSSNDLKRDYLRHIEHAVSILGIDKVGVSSDNMEYLVDVLKEEDVGDRIFEYGNINKELQELLASKYSKEDTLKIICNNSYNYLFREE